VAGAEGQAIASGRSSWLLQFPQRPALSAPRGAKACELQMTHSQRTSSALGVNLRLCGDEPKPGCLSSSGMADT